MWSVRRRAAAYLVFIVVLIALSTVVYDVGMRTFEPGPYPPEGTEVSMLHSMQVVVETFTATGYGSDSPWASAEMNLLVMLLDVIGVGLFFLALPAVFFPLLREAIAPTAPTSVDGNLDDHVVICTYTPRSEALIAELESNGVDYVLVEPDEQRALELREHYPVVHADPEAVTDLESLHLESARALVADVSDTVDASIVLAAREVSESVRIVSIVEDAGLEPYHRLAGADVVLSPRQLLGHGLAQKTTTVRTDLGGTVGLGDELDLVEVPVDHGSELAGLTLAESGIGQRYGVNIVGVWHRGRFEAGPAPDRVLDSGTVLLVTGGADQIDRLRRGTQSTVRPFGRGETVVVGYGEVGKTVTDELDDSGYQYTVVDKRSVDGVDVVGDATDPDVLREAGVASAQSVVLTLPDDTATEFTTLIARDLNDSAVISARAETEQAATKTYRAGAEYVLSLDTVSGRAIAGTVLDTEDILSVDTQLEIVRTTAPALDGRTLGDARIRERTGCTVVAVERNGAVLTEIGPEFRLRPGDELVIAGTDHGTNRFVRLFS
ncbi:TrkA family potassium uptake protein [Halalkalicoccus sp. NIPERK01]|uniref:potassium channel family protein n=1 Tax=Halalkalicoccus sp. NIPERK01 TaxID=3053469 RepID=UPI00256F2BBA|nr:NAD-binding protein [Halalkalicoccus sp. NIPERK01]MDL5362060.1 NAD-binding protein [Halalkalicoccus sp. NIPERK01]